MEDHLHMLSSLSKSKNIAFSELIGRVKGSSSKRLKEKAVHVHSLREKGCFLVSFRWRHRLSLEGLEGCGPSAAAAGRQPTSFHGADGADALQGIGQPWP